MFLASFPAGPWQTNCYLIGAQPGADIVVVDPGVGAVELIDEAAEKHGLTIAGVLLTHGHIDHVASAATVADAHGVPAWIHPAERELLSDAGPVLPAALNLARQFGVDLREPADLRELTGGEVVEVAGLAFRTIHAPGHRPGHLMYAVDHPEAGASQLLFTGDVLFAGSIGRTDLPGGDPEAMKRTLAEVVLHLPDDWAVLPGHGPATSIGHERATNPFLQPSFLR